MLLGRMTIFARQLSTAGSSGGSVARKVAVLGAAGGIGQPMSLLLKLSPGLLSDLALYDIANMGMAADLSHIDTAVRVTGHSGEAELPAALQGAQVVIIPAGVPRKPGMTRDDLFSINAGIVRGLAQACAQHCPTAHLLVISNPVNSTVPIAYETMRAAGVSRPSVFGVTTLDGARARTFVGQLRGRDPQSITVKVIGGHSGTTIVPLLSTSGLSFSNEETTSLTNRIQFGGDEVVKAKAGGGSATLSMAHAAVAFFSEFCRGLAGQSTRVIAYVKTQQQGVAGKGPFDTDYIATEVDISASGLQTIHSLPQMNPFEKDLYQKAVGPLKAEIQKGVDFALAAPAAARKA